ncbi:PREDICTED: LOW QUALITY PROTEIN: exonuclease 1-like [Branchiostoma belcheri]|uniref:LOW QUALITY PROTEIN: exonuclease 1-like n=1 Tax=Branchiostoma belcheri TaxID=7741 RepID=A0A6P5AH34_BRABE|nr:PREDICTED: LOW QUALITY PROTEIN: exonuclease 1-like [Branchiostoma belcheri]
MGIKGLLPALSPSTRPININDLTGSVVGVDASCWLHRGSYSCAKELVLGQPTDGYVNFFMSSIERLLQNDVTPLVVFDGPRTLPAKAKEAAERRRKREVAKLQARTAIDQQRARSYYLQAVSITPEMVDRVIEALEVRGVDYVVAPYEADAQLAFFSMNGAVRFIISEDSDLLAFGAKEVVYKWDPVRLTGQLISQNSLHLSFPDFRDFSHDKFQTICILAGCDYLTSIFGIGVVKAAKFVNAIGDRNIFQVRFDPLPDVPAANLTRTWTTEQMLNTTDQSDFTFVCTDESEEGSSSSSTKPKRNLRSDPLTQANVVNIGTTFKWTIPCFPVMSLTFRQATVSIDGQLKPAVFDAADQRVLLYPSPFDIVLRETCSISVDNKELLVIWTWDFASLATTSSEDILSQVPHSTLSSASIHTVQEYDYMSDSDSDSDKRQHDREGKDDDEVGEPRENRRRETRLSDEDPDEDSDDDSFDTHELPFKVMGVTYHKRYQDVLEEAYNAINDNNNTPKADIIPEPDNSFDPNAIAVRIYTDNGPEKVGYIQQALTQHVHQAINTQRLGGVRIGRIAFRTTWYHPGWYLKLLITKLGKWEGAVVQKALRVK